MSVAAPDAREQARVNLVSAMKRAVQADSNSVRKNLAEAIVNYRAQFSRPDGRPDLTGRTREYKVALQEAREAANATSSAIDSVLNALRYYTADEVRNYIRGTSPSEDDYQAACQYYGIKSESVNERKVNGQRLQRGIARQSTVGSETILVLLEAACDRLDEDVTAARDGRYRKPKDMSPDTVARLSAAVGRLSELMPEALEVWRAHLND